ncbi:hypothetical protein IAU60_006514 [Kwoniella sp. DSM 27419]
MACFFPSKRDKGIRLNDDDVEAGQGLVEKGFDLWLDEKVVSGDMGERASDPDELVKRLADLRQEIDKAGLDWYVVPSEDEHQSEEVGDSDKRREWISGFTGSAGTALIPSTESDNQPALLFVDSRYWIQAGKQVPPGWEVVRLGAGLGRGTEAVVAGWVDWVIKNAKDGLRIGIDPKLISLDAARAVHSRLATRNSATRFLAIEDNLVDRFRDVPARSDGPLNDYPIQFSGETTASKLSRVRALLESDYSSDWIYVLPALPSIAWLLNFRCPSDIPFCPVAYAYLVLTPDACAIFVDEGKVQDEGLRSRWKEEGVTIKPYGVEELGKYVKGRTSLRHKSAQIVLAAPECSWALSKVLEPAKVELISCPVDRLKIVKNAVEQQGFRNAYLRDGRAMVRWMAWLEKTILKEERKVGEWAAAQTLTRYRRQEEFFAGLAYEDISASGPNGALPHYAPQRGQDILVGIDSPYVIDSGAQYLDGTIDTTRTLYLGAKPSDEIKRAYTRVLQGHLAVSTAVFPRGMPADRLNMIARAPLYQDGLDFGHGLGHGIGTYLAVHESPVFPKNAAFVPGNITSIEPGYYKEGEWGMRIESVVVCKELESPEKPDGLDTSNFLTFDRITQVPIATNMVDYALLSKAEIRWLNEHNTSVQDTLWPLLQADEDADARDWLKRVCKPKKIWPWTGA